MHQLVPTLVVTLSIVLSQAAAGEMPAEVRAQIEAQMIGDWTWEATFGEEKYQGEESLTWAADGACMLLQGYAMIDGRKEAYQGVGGWRPDEKAVVFSAFCVNGDCSTHRWGVFSADAWTGEGSGVYMGKVWKSPAKLEFKGDCTRYEDTTEGKPWVKVSRRKAPTSHSEHLKVLEPFFGPWLHESVALEPIPGVVEKGAPIRVPFKYRWAVGNQAVVMNWAIEAQDGKSLKGIELIGWDPEKQQVVSRGFRSDGGMAFGVWTVEGKTLRIEDRSVGPDGSVTTSTVFNKLTDEGTMIWCAVKGVRDGTKLPDTPEMTFRRVQP